LGDPSKLTYYAAKCLQGDFRASNTNPIQSIDTLENTSASRIPSQSRGERQHGAWWQASGSCCQGWGARIQCCIHAAKCLQGDFWATGTNPLQRIDTVESKSASRHPSQSPGGCLHGAWLPPMGVVVKVGRPKQVDILCRQVPPRRLSGIQHQSNSKYRHFREYISLQDPLPKPGRTPTWGLVAGQWEWLSWLGGQDPVLHPCCQVPPGRLWGNRDHSTLIDRHFREYISLQAPLPKPSRMPTWGLVAADGSCCESWETQAS
jgi:hypothetical protein